MRPAIQLAIVLAITVISGCNRGLDINHVGGTKVVFQLQMPLGASEEEVARSIERCLDPAKVFDIAASVSKDSLTIDYPRRNEADVRVDQLHRGLMLGSTLEVRSVALTTDTNIAAAVAATAADSDEDTSEIRSEEQVIAVWRPIASDGKGALQVQTLPANFTRQNNGKTELLLRVTAADVSSVHLDTANKVFTEQDRPAIGLRLNASGAETMKRLSEANQGQQLAIVIGQQIVAAPLVMSTMTDRAQITGNFTDGETQTMVEQLRLGSLPFHVTDKPPVVSVVHKKAD
ncbi:MAG: hypothetical protein AB8G99_04525 [Planctomycetaceae bacterium]